MGFADILSFLGMVWVPVEILNFASCIMGSLNVCSGESSTRTLFLRVMDTFDDDDDDISIAVTPLPKIKAVILLFYMF